MSASLGPTDSEDEKLRCDGCGAEFVDADAAWSHACQSPVIGEEPVVGIPFPLNWLE